MKQIQKAVCLIGCMLVIFTGFAQNSKTLAIPLSSLQTSNNPCFQLLDIAPSSIEHPADPSEFAMSALSQVSSSGALPKNFAFEAAPYWYFKPSKMNVYRYLNIDSVMVHIDSVNKQVDTSVKHFYFTGILNKLSVSIASSFSDSTAGSLLKNTNYISFGVQTNILTIRGKTNDSSIHSDITALKSRLHFFNGAGITPQQLADGISKDSAYKADSAALVADLNTIPIIQLDAAYAYSGAFAGNSISQSRFNRDAAWLTLTLGIPLKKKDENLALLGIVGLMKDNVLTDTTHNIFQKKSATDLGGKISYSSGNFSIGVEFVTRSYAGNAALNSNRCVGLLQYKVNSSLYLSASFGQNFGGVNNLFSAIGLNFGFGSKSSPLPY